MQRDLAALSGRTWDVLVVGGGAFGACAAWDAALRGLSVALIEREDFAAGVSANSFKMIHGGIRYLQHADIERLRASCRERSALLRIAPHLVQPLPIVIPTYGHGGKGKAFLGAGMLLYDLLTAGRNRGIRDPARRIPRSRFLGRRALLELFPDLDTAGLTGAALFHDGQMYNPTRLVLAFVQSAAAAGAQAANYVAAERLLRNDDRVLGVQARDLLSGDSFPIQARVVVNAAGPWAERLLEGAGTAVERGTWSRDACFVVPRRFDHPYALAVTGRTRDPDAVLARPARHLFLVPWRDHTLVGVWHKVWEDGPDRVGLDDAELDGFIDEVNWAYPGLGLARDQVTLHNSGLVPFGENRPGAVHLSYGKRSRLVDHRRTHGVKGLVTLMGIRYTMARADAMQAIDLACAQLGRRPARPPTATVPLHGGEIADFERFVATEAPKVGHPGPVARALLHNYGTAWREVAGFAADDGGTLPGSTVLAAEVVHAVRREMARRLADIVFRRTDLATAGHPGEAALDACARLAARELGWSARRTADERAAVTARFPVPPARQPPLPATWKNRIPAVPK